MVRAFGVRLDLSNLNSTSLCRVSSAWPEDSLSLPAGLPLVEIRFSVGRVSPADLVLPGGRENGNGCAATYRPPAVGPVPFDIGTFGMTGPPCGRATASAVVPAAGSG